MVSSKGRAARAISIGTPLGARSRRTRLRRANSGASEIRPAYLEVRRGWVTFVFRSEWDRHVALRVLPNQY